MANFFTISSIISFLACLALGILYAWLLYGKLKHLPVRLIIILSLFRTLAITLLIWMLFAPLFKKVSYTLEKPIIILAQDNSLSVGQVMPAKFDQINYQKQMQELSTKLSEKYEVKTYSFSDSVKTGLDFSGKGKLSNGAVLIEQLKDEVMNRNIGAIIIASDGIFNRGGNPLYDLKQLNAPVYTIGLGDTVPKKDVLIADINYNNLVYLDNEFTLSVQVQAFQSKGEKTRLTVTENGVKVKDEIVDLNANSFVKDIPIKMKARKVGVQKYNVSVSSLKNEITTKNNSQTIFVEVIDGRQKILIVSGTAHPDVTVLKQAIEINKHYEVALALPDDLNQVELNKYSLAILYQFPGDNNSSLNLLNQIKGSRIPIWCILGAQTDMSGLAQLQGLVKLNRATGAIQEVFPLIAPNFTLFALETNADAQLKDYDPLQMPFGNLIINGSYSAILNQKIGKVNTQSPLWFFMDNNGRKIAFLLGEGIWKWKLEEAKNVQSFPLVNELVSKTLQYLSVKDDKRKFKVYANKSTFDENEQVILNASLYNDAYEPINTSEVAIKIRPENGKIFNYNFSKFGSSYRLDAGSLPEGNYTFIATTNLGDKKYSFNGSFYVKALITEFQQTTANHQLLYTMAQQNNGKMLMPSNLLSVLDEINKNEQIKTIRYEDRKYEELINFKFLFIFILLLLSLEWFLRKRNGEV
ncbi:hypothetical protein [Pedobacter insulae]|uniref:VWA domain-containing protein n=1 Tax=Pedobacter insulae TaxID=414048 RepID=A0A1I2VYV4_9SPHI|nr:hypothetical protein [Pedobacter insulae]SFG94330.1 hypothetical protein SAMN04489864_103359 [Pedobacter insulae]